VASRRKCEELITSGHITVNGKVVTDLATIISPSDKVTFDNRPVKNDNKFFYIIMNKPKGFVTTCSDEKGRKTVLDLLEQKTRCVGNQKLPQGIRFYPVGRLDINTSGLLILTNDGDFARHLTHPSTKIPKTYVATIDKQITKAHLKQLEQGVMLEGERTHPAKARNIHTHATHTTTINTSNNSCTNQGDTIYSTSPDIQLQHSVVELVITQGRNRQVRNMFNALGYNVTSLKRTAIGNLTLSNLKLGQFTVSQSKPLI